MQKEPNLSTGGRKIKAIEFFSYQTDFNQARLFILSRKSEERIKIIEKTLRVPLFPPCD